MSIRLGIEHKAEELGYTLFKEPLDQLTDKAADGTIALGKFDQKQIEALSKLKGKLLFTDFDASTFGFDSLVIDFSQSVDLVLEQLLKEGHQQIGILTGVEYTKGSEQPLSDPRYNLFKQKMMERKLFNEKLVIKAPFSVESGYQEMLSFLDSGTPLPDALFASSDALAIGAMRALQERGIQIPNDLSIIGFNDVSVAKYVSPPLSTVKVYTEWMGELAVSTVAELIKEEAPVPRKIMLATELVNRSSTKG